MALSWLGGGEEEFTGFVEAINLDEHGFFADFQAMHFDGSAGNFDRSSV